MQKKFARFKYCLYLCNVKQKQQHSNNGQASRKVAEFMKQNRFRICSNRDYKIEVFDCRNKLITVIRDSGYYNMSQIFNDVAYKCMGSPRVPKYVTISCEETEEWGKYTMKGTKIL